MSLPLSVTVVGLAVMSLTVRFLDSQYPSASRVTVSGKAEELCTATAPLPLSADTARPEAGWRAAQARLGTSGRLAPAAYTLTLPAAAPGT